MSKTGPGLLELDHVTLRFGGLIAVDDVSFSIKQGEVFSIIGPNGAGKSTLFNLISRFYTPNSGDIRFEGHSLLDKESHNISALGIARTFQNIELFEHSSVLQNLLIGRHTHRKSHFLSELLFTPFVRQQERDQRAAVEQVIDFLDLQPYRDQMIMGLPYGV